MKLGDFLNNLARKCNKENDPALIAILSNSELANRDVSDDFANALDRELMSLDGAKNNALLRTHFTAQALNGVDTELLNLANELELGDEVVNSFKSEKNTYNKFRSLKDIVRSLKEKSAKEGDSTKKAEYEKQIVELHAKIAQKEDESKAMLEEERKTHQQEITEFLVHSSLMGKPYANKELPQDVQLTLAKTILDNALLKTGAVIVRDGKSLKLKQKENPDMDYLENHKPVSFDDFLNKTLADSKLLAVSGVQPNTPTNPNAPYTVPADSKVNMSRFEEAFQEAAGKQ